MVEGDGGLFQTRNDFFSPENSFAKFADIQNGPLFLLFSSTAAILSELTAAFAAIESSVIEKKSQP